MTKAAESQGETKPLLYLEDLYEGMKFQGGHELVSAEDIKSFAAQYDPQPFHLDETAAQSSFFGTLVASGWQTACLSMRMLVAAIPVAGGLVGASGSLKWLKPTYPNDTLSIEATVIGIRKTKAHTDRGFVTFSITTLNQHNEAVQAFECNILVGSKAQPPAPT